MFKWIGATFFMIMFFICLNIVGCTYFIQKAKLIQMENKNLELQIKQTELEIAILKRKIKENIESSEGKEK